MLFGIYEIERNDLGSDQANHLKVKENARKNAPKNGLKVDF